MRRRGVGRGAGVVVRAAQGGRGRPRMSEGARARAQENLRERSIEKVPGTRGWSGGGAEAGARTPGGCGGLPDWSRKERKGWPVAKAQGGLWGVLRVSAAKLTYSSLPGINELNVSNRFCIFF